MNMRLLGARNLKEVVPEMVDASSIHSHTVAVPGDRLYESNCECSFVWVFHSESLIHSCRRRHAARASA